MFLEITYSKTYPTPWTVFSIVCWVVLGLELLIYVSTFSWFWRQNFSSKLKAIMGISFLAGFSSTIYSCLYYTRGINVFFLIQTCNTNFIIGSLLPLVAFITNSYFITHYFTEFGRKLSHLKAFEYATRTEGARHATVIIGSLMAVVVYSIVMFLMKSKDLMFQKVIVGNIASGCFITPSDQHQMIFVMMLLYVAAFDLFYASQWFRRLILFAQGGPRVPSDKILLSQAKQIFLLTGLELFVIIPLAILWCITCEPGYPTLIIFCQSLTMFLKQPMMERVYRCFCGPCANLCLFWIDDLKVRDYSSVLSTSRREFSEHVSRAQKELALELQLAQERAEVIENEEDSLRNDLVDMCCEVLDKGMEFGDSLLLVAHEFNPIRVEYSLLNAVERVIGTYPMPQKDMEWLFTFVLPSHVWFKKYNHAKPRRQSLAPYISEDEDEKFEVVCGTSSEGTPDYFSPSETSPLLRVASEKRLTTKSESEFLYQELIKTVKKMQKSVVKDLARGIQSLETSVQFRSLAEIESVDASDEFHRYFKEHTSNYGLTAPTKDSHSKLSKIAAATIESATTIQQPSDITDDNSSSFSQLDESTVMSSKTQSILSRMFRTVRDVNPRFQTLMADIFDGHGDYQSGSIKTYSVTKSENENSEEMFPRSLQLKDVMRCSVVFQQPSDLVEGFEHFLEEARETRMMKVFRVKNGYRGWRRAKAMTYRDLRVNVLFSYDESFSWESSIVGEIDLVLAPYIVLKERVAKLHEIVKRRKFFDAVVDRDDVDAPWYVIWCSAFW